MNRKIVTSNDVFLKQEKSKWKDDKGVCLPWTNDQKSEGIMRWPSWDTWGISIGNCEVFSTLSPKVKLTVEASKATFMPSTILALWKWNWVLLELNVDYNWRIKHYLFRFQGEILIKILLGDHMDHLPFGDCRISMNLRSDVHLRCNLILVHFVAVCGLQGFIFIEITSDPNNC